MTQETREQGAPRAPRVVWLDLLAWLALVGAITLTFSDRMAWARIQVSLTDPTPGSGVAFGITGTTWQPVPVTIALHALVSQVSGGRQLPWIVFLWGVSLVSGVVLALAMAIWRKSQLAAYLYLIWPVLATLVVAGLLYTIFGRPPQALCEVNCQYIIWGPRTASAGAWLAVSGLALLWVGDGARLASIRADVRRASMPSVRAMLRSLAEPARAAALIITLGVLVWFFGFIFTPWATQGCTGYPVNWYHFVSGSCSGTDSDGALARAALGGYGPSSQTIWVEAYALFMLLAALIAVWQRGWAPLVVALLWAAPATWLTGIAISGIPALLANPPQLTYSASPTPWVVGYGPAVSIAGLALVWAGVLALVWRAVIARRARTARLTPESADAA